MIAFFSYGKFSSKVGGDHIETAFNMIAANILSYHPGPTIHDILWGDNVIPFQNQMGCNLI